MCNSHEARWLMQYFKRRHVIPRDYDASAQKWRMLASHRVKRCSRCTYLFPEEDMTIEDGLEVCPMCVDLYTADYLAREEMHVAEVQEQSALQLVIPPQYSIRPLAEARPGVVTNITDSFDNDVDQNSSPLDMTRNVAVGLLLYGQYFTAACTTSYPTGITDASAPVITPAVAGGTPALITLTLIAALGMTPGQYDLTFNDGVSAYGTTFFAILSVR
jgi:hypothetical protein